MSSITHLLDYSIPGANTYGVIMLKGAISGAITGGSKGALIGAFTAAAFHGVGEGFSGLDSGGKNFLGSGLSGGQFAAKIGAHGLVGGASSVLQGGKFGHGFAAAGLTQAFAPGIGKLPYKALKITVAAIVGGSISEATGGKFAMGAVTGAFSRAFNDEASVDDEENNISSKSVNLGNSTFNYTIEGPTDFKETIYELITDIASTEAGLTLLKTITSNEGNVHLKYTVGKEAVAEGSLINRNTEIRVDPSFKQGIHTNLGPRNAKFKFIFAHELHHAWKNTLNCWIGCNKSLYLSGDKFPTGVTSREGYAVRYTNKLRTELRVGYQRTFFSRYE